MLTPRRAAAAARTWDSPTNAHQTSKTGASYPGHHSASTVGSPMPHSGASTAMHVAGGYDAPPAAAHYMAAAPPKLQATPRGTPGKSVRPTTAPCTPPSARTGNSLPSTPQTPSQLEPTLITSSPRIQKKQSKLSKLRGTASASKLMFSPPYSKTLKPSSQQNKAPILQADDMDVDLEMSPVKKRLQYNLALHGHKDQKFDEYDETEFDPWRFIASLHVHLLPPPVRTCLPPKMCNRPTLVLDLDETLVHCSTDPGEIKNPHFVFSVDFNGQTFKVTAKRRPGLEEFLEHIKDKFEVVIFTASQKVYADKVLDIIDPKREVTKLRVFRDDCCNVDGNYLKDLRVLGRDLRRMVIVDNSPQAFSFQLDNGLPILSWFDNEDDTELYKVIRVLDRLAVADDMRPILRSRFKLHHKVQAKSGRI